MHYKHNAEAYKRTAYFLSIDTKQFERSDMFERNFDLGQDDKVSVLRYKDMATASKTV